MYTTSERQKGIKTNGIDLYFYTFKYFFMKFFDMWESHATLDSVLH
jgi:hypothetical protein